jgi:hypothetical protein
MEQIETTVTCVFIDSPPCYEDAGWPLKTSHEKKFYRGLDK